jgi:hypothetical protein
LVTVVGAQLVEAPHAYQPLRAAAIRVGANVLSSRSVAKARTPNGSSGAPLSTDSGSGTGELDAGTLSGVDCLAALLVSENSLMLGNLRLAELPELPGDGVVP